MPAGISGSEQANTINDINSMNYFNTNILTLESQDAVAMLEAPAKVNSEANENRTLNLSFFSGCRDNSPKQSKMDWHEFCRRFGVHTVRDHKDGAAWSPASFGTGQPRRNEFVEALDFAVIDIDDNGVQPNEIEDRFKGFAYLLHSSYGHTNTTCKFRMILPFAEPVLANDWPIVWARINAMVDGHNDPSTKDASRLYYMPSCPVGSSFSFVREGKGRYLSMSDLPSDVTVPENRQQLFPHSVSTTKLAVIEGIESSGPDLNFEQGLRHVVSRCAFMRTVSASENQQSVSEPLWMAMISNACRFENSEAWIHVASEHHSGYDEGATTARIERYRNGSAPITCQRIRELGFEGCPTGGCARPNGLVAKAPAALGTWMFRRQLTADETDRGPIPEKYPVNGNFLVQPTGVFKVSEKDGEQQLTKLSSRIDVTALTRDADSSNWGTELSFQDPDGVKKTWALPMELLASTGESYRASLYRMGVAIEPTKTARDGLAEYLNAARPNARALSVTQPGWSSTGVFVLPDATYGESNNRLVFQTTDPDNMKRYSRKGTLESWQQNVAAPCQGNSRAVLSICVGMATPLLALLGEDNGGFHIRGNSSSGKTVCLGIGASVWGGAPLIRTWNMTTNGVEGVAVMHNDVLLPLDELGQADGKAAGEAAYMFGNGQGKGRANKEGNARAAKRFRTLVLSSGERSLADLMTQAGLPVMAGQEVRMVEISADAGRGYGIFENIHGAQTSQVFAESMKHAIAQHHGHAGRAFVNVLAAPALQPKLVEMVKVRIQRFVEENVPAGSAGQVGRVARRFGLVAAAGELAIELGILPWPVGEASAAARKCFVEWIEERDGTGNQEEVRALTQVRRFIEANGESRFTPWHDGIDSSSDSKTINRAGFRKAADDGRTEYFIFPETYRTEVCRGFNPTAVTKLLIEKGLLNIAPDGKAQVQVRIPGTGRTRAYHLKADILGSQSEKEESDRSHLSTSKLAGKYSV